MATEYQVNTTLSNGTTINSGTIIIPDATIPIANSTTLGGVMPVDKTDGMTQEVGVDSTGKLYTAPGGGGGGSGGGTTITCNNQNVETVDLTNVTFQPRYEVESSSTVNISPNNSVKWDPIKVTGTNVLGNWINSQNSLIELGMGNSADITLTKSTDPTNGEYLQWVLSQSIKDDIAGKQDTLVSGTNIKTINGNSLLGSGNLTISGGGGGGVPTISVALKSSGSTSISSSDYNIVSADGVTAIIDTKASPTGSNDIYYKSGDTDNYIYFTCQDAISSSSSDLITRVLLLGKTPSASGYNILRYNYYTHKTYYCNFSNNPNIEAGFYIVLDGLSQFTPSGIAELYQCFGQNITYIPIAGTYNDGTGLRPIQYLYYDGNSNSGSIYYLDSSNTLQSVDVSNENITCILLPDN